MAHPGLVGPPPSCNSPRHPPPPPLLIAFASSGAGRKSRVRRRISFPRHCCCFHCHRHSCKGLVAMDVDAPSPLLPRVGTASSSSSSSSPLLRGVQALKSVQSTETDKTEESDDTFLDVEDGRMPKTNKRESAKDIDMYKTKKRGNTGRFLLGVELTPDVVAIAMVYFVQGVLGLSRLAVSFFLKDDLHLDPAETPDVVAIAMVNFIQGVLGLSHFAVSFFLNDDLHLDPAETAVISGVSAVPWLVKPIYGFISDGFPLFGYRRRSYLILCGLLGAMAWAIMATFVDSKYGAMMAILLSSLSVAFSDVVVDSMAVERARGEPQSTSGSIQSLCWGFSAAGGIISAYFSGSLVQLYGVRFVFGVTALLPLMTSAVAVLVSEERTAFFSNADMNKENDMSTSKGVGVPPGHVKMQLVHLWKAVKEPSILLPTLFIFLWQATPTSDTAMFFFTTNKLAFGPEFLGRVRLITSVASLAGVAIYNGFLKSVPLRRMFFWTTILGAGLSLTQLLLVTGVNQKLGISNEWFAMGDNLILTVLGQVSFMPILVLAAKLCPPGVEATLFATLMSLCNGGSVTGGLLGAALTRFLGVTSENFDNIALLLIICNSTSLLPLFFLRLLPSEMEVENTADKVEKASKNPRDLKKH